MVLVVALIAGLLVVAESQASDTADQSKSLGFLSRYLPVGSDASRTPVDHYDKFIAPNLDVKEGYGGKAILNMGDRSFTTLHDKPVHLTAQAPKSMGFRAVREESLISTKEFNLPKIGDQEGMKAVQKLFVNGSNTPITLSAIGIGLLTLATMLGVGIRKMLQPATVAASSGALGSVSKNMAPGLGDNIMEMQAESSGISGAVACETRHPNKETSGKVGWGQPHARILLHQHSAMQHHLATKTRRPRTTSMPSTS
jgi:hypothetical protein